jgi:hypothetical protein
MKAEDIRNKIVDRLTMSDINHGDCAKILELLGIYDEMILEENNQGHQTNTPIQIGSGRTSQNEVICSGSKSEVKTDDTHSTKHIFQTIPKDSVSYLPSDTKQELNKEISKDYGK